MQVEHLDVSRRVDLMDGVSRRAARLPVQVVALHEHRVVAQTAQPHVTLALHVQLHALADVQSGGGGVFRDAMSVSADTLGFRPFQAFVKGVNSCCKRCQ